MDSFVLVVPLHRGASLGKNANKCDRWQIFEYSDQRAISGAAAHGAQSAARQEDRENGEWGILVAGGHGARLAGAGVAAKKKGKA